MTVEHNPLSCVDPSRAQEKLLTLRAHIEQMGALAVSFSGGVDSSFLLAVAQQELPGRVIALTETSALYPQRETTGAIDFCKMRQIPHVLTEHRVEGSPAFDNNPRNRCYLCKTALFGQLRQLADEKARELGFIGPSERIAYAEGSNASDMNDYRPGYQAVLEQGALSPLLEVGLTKDEIRWLSRQMGLATWDKPSFACLATRFPYGTAITTPLLERVSAAEQLFFDAGFRQVRVRTHEAGCLARVEVEPARMEDAFRFLQEGAAHSLRTLGYSHVSLDMTGYYTGSMNA